MNKKKIVFIINPFSGVSQNNNLGDLIEKYLDYEKFEPILRYTEHAGHATDIALEAVKDNTDIVVAVGGDGTINEVATSLVHTNTALGIIPTGSGNGFARHLGISRKPMMAIKSLNTSSISIIDTCLANKKFYINISGVGFDGYISNLIRGKAQRGRILYAFNMLNAVLKYKSNNYKVKIEDSDALEGQFYTIAVANASIYGYQFHIAPNADLYDGLLDIVLVKDAPMYKHFMSIPNYFMGTTDKIKHIEIIQAKSLKISSTSKIDYHLDGEGEETLDEISFEVVPKSLKIFA